MSFHPSTPTPTSTPSIPPVAMSTSPIPIIPLPPLQATSTSVTTTPTTSTTSTTITLFTPPPSTPHLTITPSRKRKRDDNDTTDTTSSKSLESTHPLTLLTLPTELLTIILSHLDHHTLITSARCTHRIFTNITREPATWQHVIVTLGHDTNPVATDSLQPILTTPLHAVRTIDCRGLHMFAATFTPIQFQLMIKHTCQSLTSLNCGTSVITDAMLAALIHTSHLTSFHTHMVKILKDAEMEILHHLSSLKTLSITLNSLNINHLITSSSMKTLTTLYLDIYHAPNHAKWSTLWNTFTSLQHITIICHAHSHMNSTHITTLCTSAHIPSTCHILHLCMTAIIPLTSIALLSALTSLSLSSPHSHDDEDITSLAQLTKLQHLDLDVDISCEPLISGTFQSLKSFRPCQTCTGDSLVALVTASPMLESLDLSYLDLDDHDIQRVLMRCSHLRTLCLRGCDSITDLFISALITSPAHSTITDLDITMCSGITTTTHDIILQHVHGLVILKLDASNTEQPIPREQEQEQEQVQEQDQTMVQEVEPEAAPVPPPASTPAAAPTAVQEQESDIDSDNDADAVPIPSTRITTTWLTQFFSSSPSFQRLVLYHASVAFLQRAKRLAAAINRKPAIQVTTH